jgi:hypothetical protein
MLDGRIVYVSADSRTDERTKMPYYDARIEVDRPMPGSRSIAGSWSG